MYDYVGDLAPVYETENSAINSNISRLVGERQGAHYPVLDAATGVTTCALCDGEDSNGATPPRKVSRKLVRESALGYFERAAGESE